MPKRKKRKLPSSKRPKKRARIEANTVELSPQAALPMLGGWVSPFKSLDKFRRYDWKDQQLKTELSGVEIMRFEADSESKLWVNLKKRRVLESDSFDDALQTAMFQGGDVESLPTEVIVRTATSDASKIRTQLEQVLDDFEDAEGGPAMEINEVKQPSGEHGMQFMRFLLQGEKEKEVLPPITTFGRTGPDGQTSGVGGGSGGSAAKSSSSSSSQGGASSKRERAAGGGGFGGDGGDDDDDPRRPNKKDSGPDGEPHGSPKRRAGDDEDEKEGLEAQILHDGWLRPPQMDTIKQQLGADTAHQLMKEVLASGRPSALATMAKNLENPQFKPLTNNSAIILGDALRAWKRVESAIDEMLPEEAKQGEGKTLRDRIHEELLRNIQPMPRQAQGTALQSIINDVANYARGNQYPLLKRLNPGLQSRPSIIEHLPLDLSRFNLPSASVIAQAEGTLVGLQGSQPVITLQTLATQGGDIDVMKPPQNRSSARHVPIIAELKRRDRGNLLTDTERTELADIISAALRDRQKPKIVTTNWNVLRVLLRLGPTGRPIPDGQSSEVRNNVEVAGARLDIHGIASPANLFPNPTQVGELGSLENPIAYGTAVRVSRANPFYRQGQREPQFWADQGYLYGYTPLGEAVVLLDNGELLYTLSGRDRIELSDELPPFPPEIEHPRTRIWKMKTTRLDNSTNEPANVLFSKYAGQLQALTARAVAGSAHTVREYTDLIRKGGFQSYIVGGATRDILIGKDPKDIDLASTMPALDAFQAIVTSKDDLGKKSGRQGQLEVRRNVPFGTVQVQPSDETGLDIISTHDSSGHNASLRLDFDALARDFTVNAVYYDVDQNTLLDPTGYGLDDLMTRRVRFIQGTADEVLSKDPVMVARWIKMMSKKDGAEQYFQAQDHQDVEIAFKWLLHYADPQNMDERVRARFVDRMTATATEAETNVRRIFSPVGKGDEAVAAIRRIYGVF